MTDIVSSLDKIQQEEVDFKSALSENTMTKIGSSINGIIEGNGEPLGTVITSILTVGQFTAIRPASKWLRMEGQSIAGSELETLTGLATLPDMTTTGAFIGQSDLGESTLGDYQASANKDHNHTLTTGAGGANTTSVAITATDSPLTNATVINEDGATYAQPETIRMNFFIKVNN